MVLVEQRSDGTYLEVLDGRGIRERRTPYTLPRIRYDPSEAPATVIARIRAAGG